MVRMNKPGARSGEVDLGEDGIVSASKGSHALRRRNPPASISLDGAGFMPAAVPPARAGGARSGAALCRQNDRAEPGASHALNRALRALRADRSCALSAASLSPALYAGRRGTAGLGRCSARELE